jgi:hypothetical protein
LAEHLIMKYRTGWSLLICGGFFIYWLARSWVHIPHDFANSYFGAYFFLKGAFDQHIFDPYTFNKLIFDEGFREVFVSYTPNPPSTSFLFIPFALLPLSVSKLVFNIVCIVLFFRTLFRLCNHYGVPIAYVLLTLPILFLLPIRNQILFGQSYFLIFVLIVEGYLCYEKKYLWASAFLWATAIFIKVFPLMIVLYLLLKKDWKMTGVLTAVCLMLGGLFILLQGPDIWKFYLAEILPRSSRGELSWAYTPQYQSALMFFKYIFIYESKLNPQPLVDSPAFFTGSLIIFNACVLMLGVLICKKHQDLLGIGAILLTASLLSSAASTYGNLLLLVILIPAFRHYSRSQTILLCLLVFFIANIPLTYFKSWPLVFQFSRLFLSLALLLVVTYFARPTVKPFRIAVILACIVSILLVPAFFRPHKTADQSSLLLKEEKHSIIFDYAIEKGELAYYYWSEQGKTRYATGLSFPPVFHNNLELKNNQVYIDGKPVTFTADNKIKPAFIYPDTIIYLSDKGRGYGFYTLRTLAITPPKKLISHE